MKQHRNKDGSSQWLLAKAFMLPVLVRFRIVRPIQKIIEILMFGVVMVWPNLILAFIVVKEIIYIWSCSRFVVAKFLVMFNC